MQEIFNEMICHQEKKLLQIANEILPNVTSDDILQPFDFPLLEQNPHFRYEEGFLKGLYAAQFAILNQNKV